MQRWLRGTNEGFTLIELLFIVAIIGVIIAISLNSYRQRADNLRLEKTALQMQQILQAGVNFNSDNGCWPQSSSQNPACPTNVPAFSTYLPAGISNNPWGNPYTYQQDPNTPTNFLVYSGSIPNKNATGRIMALLPNAIIDPQNSQQLIAATNFNAIRNALSIQTLSLNTQIAPSNSATASIPFSCPNGWQPSAVQVPVTLQTQPWTTGRCVSVYGFGSYAIKTIASNFMRCLNTSNPSKGVTNYSCYFINTYNGNFLNGCTWQTQNMNVFNAVELGYCIPPSAQKKTPLL